MNAASGKVMSDNGKKSFKLMIVDDSNIMRRRIERSNQFDELELVGTASNGLEALEMFKKMDPDVVTMDLTMPQMDGIECISKLVVIEARGADSGDLSSCRQGNRSRGYGERGERLSQ